MDKEEGKTMKLPDKPCIIVSNGQQYVATELTKVWRKKIYNGPKSPIVNVLQNMLGQLFQGEHKKKVEKDSTKLQKCDHCSRMFESDKYKAKGKEGLCPDCR